MFEAMVPDLDTLWRGVLDSAVRIPPLVTTQAADVQVRIRDAFDRLCGAHRRPDGSLRDPGLGPGDPGPPAVSARPFRVAYTGEPGAFAEEAVLRFFASPEAVPLSSFRAVFEAVRDGEADAGVVPVESSLLGTIRENLDLLYEFHLPIVGEVSVPVRLALLALPGERLETIERVYSISAALAQADEFLRSRPWTIQTTYNTAGAAKQIADRGERGAAAVASARVAPIYGLRGPRGRHPDRRREPHPVQRGRAAGRRGGGAGRRQARGRGRAPADLARVRRAQHAGVAPPLARGVLDPRDQPVPPRVPSLDGARLALGVPVLGGPGRGPGVARLCPALDRAARRRPRWSGSWARTRGRRRTDPARRGWPGAAVLSILTVASGVAHGGRRRSEMAEMAEMPEMPQPELASAASAEIQRTSAVPASVGRIRMGLADAGHGVTRRLDGFRSRRKKPGSADEPDPEPASVEADVQRIRTELTDVGSAARRTFERANWALVIIVAVVQVVIAFIAWRISVGRARRRRRRIQL